MLMLPQGRCHVVTMIYPTGDSPPMLIEGKRALATRQIFRNELAALRYANGIAKCFQAKIHRVKGVQVFS